MNIQQDPFIYGRAEFEPEAAFYMPEDFVKWTSHKPQLFVGPKGSGKTSILKSLSWGVTWQVSGVHVSGPAEVRRVFSRPRHIGVYFRIEDMDLAYWKSWHTNPTSIARVFGTYMEFLWCDLLLEALAGIRAQKNTAFLERSREEAFIQALLLECFPHAAARPRPSDLSFASLQTIAKQAHLGIRDLVYRKMSEDALLRSFPVLGPGTLVQTFAEQMHHHFPASKDFVFLLLLDDCNLLDDILASVVNSAVLKSRGLVAHKLTCLTGLYPTRRTLQTHRLVTEHELETVPVFGTKAGIDMGSPSDREYLTVAEAVCRTKLETAYGPSIAGRFNFKRFFGLFRLDDLLSAKLRSTENPAAAALLQRSRTSVTKTWLREKQVRNPIELCSNVSSSLLQRRNASVFTRKWKHVAGIAICREFKIAFPYSGWNVILHLSGGSIRELLRIMSRVWTQKRHRPDRVGRFAPVPPTIQTQAVLAAASASYDAIDCKVLSPDGATLQKACNRLGYLFRECQNHPYLCIAPETAAVMIPLKDLLPDEQLSSVLAEAVSSGVLLRRVVKVKNREDLVAIGLHPILAPKYSIMFRSPFYYPQSISVRQLHTLVLGGDNAAKTVISDILSSRLGGRQGRRSRRNSGQMIDGQLELPITPLEE